MQVVTWSLKPSPDGAGGSVWMRWASPSVRTSGELQELWMRTQQFQGLEAGQLKTLKGINQWQMYCYWGSWSNCQSSGDVATAKAPAGAGSAPPQPQQPQQRQALPSGVRLVLDFAGEGLNGSLVRDVALGP
jgi:general secretion pathway protein J